MLAIVIAVLTIGGAGYLGSQPLLGWQLPAAVLLGLAGLAMAVAVAGSGTRRRDAGGWMPTPAPFRI